MWVLSPMLPPASQRALEEGGSIPNPVQYLTSGSITIGRPAKKGGTTGKADLLIFGETSVSTVHAVLEVEQLDANGAAAAVTITDLHSKFGTFVSQGHQTSRQEQRLEPEQPQPLQEHDIIRFGTKCRYQLHHIALTIYQNRQPCLPLASTAEDVDWVQACAYARSIGANISGRFDAEGIQLGMCSTENSYCVAAERSQLSTTALAAMALKVPVVTLNWMAAVAAKKSHAESLPDPAGYVVQQLLLPRMIGVQAVTVKDWKRPADDLLEGYVLLFHGKHDDNLVAASRAFGAEVHTGCHERSTGALEQAAAARARAAVSVLSESAFSEPGSQTFQPQITEGDLLPMIAYGDVSALNQLVEEHNNKKAAEAKQQAKAATAAANPTAAATQAARAQHIAAAAAKKLAATASDSADDTDDEAGDAQDNAISTELLQAMKPVLHTRRGRKAGTAASPEPQQKPPAKQAARQAAKSSLQLKPSTPGRGRGNKRSAAAVATVEEPLPSAAVAAAGATAVTPAGRKRRKLADTVAAAAARHDASGDDAVIAPAATSPAATAATTNGQQQQQQQRVNVPPPQPAADAAAGGSNGTVSTMSPLIGLREGIFAAALLVPTPQQQQQANVLQDSNGYSGVNFKAFRRKQQPGGAVQLEAGQLASAAVTAATAGYVINLVPESKHPSGPDTDAFLREERQRQERLKKADELFNATIKPIAKPTVRGRARH